MTKSKQICNVIYSFCSTKIAGATIVILLILHYMIYNLSYYIVNEYINVDINVKKSVKNLRKIRIFYNDNYVSLLKFNKSDFGEIKELNSVEALEEDIVGKMSKIKRTDPHYTNLNFRNATLDNVMFMEPLKFLKDYKNPCFTYKLSSVSNDSDYYNVEENDSVYSMKCLPYFFVAGFTKCGTTDFHGRLTRHPFVSSGWTKEPHWWDDLYQQGFTLNNYADNFQTDTEVINSYYMKDIATEKKYYPMIIGDFTPRTIWDGMNWSKDILNINESIPKVLIPHKIKHILPQAKVTVLIRNPTHRLYSDYLDLTIRYNYPNISPTPEHFHKLVVKAIKWWKRCKKIHAEQFCAYGYPKSLPVLDEAAGIKWVHNVADRLRIGMYSIYIENWLKVFDKESIKIVPLEEYMKSPLEYLERHMLPFLGLPRFPLSQKAEVKDMEIMNSRYVRLDPKLDVPMWNTTKSLLDRFYHKYQVKLKRMLDSL